MCTLACRSIRICSAEEALKSISPYTGQGEETGRGRLSEMLADLTDEDRFQALGIVLPFLRIARAEGALGERVFRPGTFVEDDGTTHQVLAFAPRPVGCSGFLGWLR